MREILFRGKENPSGEWVEGFLVGNCHIGDWVICNPIHSKTVGQFTGLTDKNGKKIFEGDLFRLDDEIIAVVIFKDGCFRLEEFGLCGAWTENGFDECGGGWGVIDCSPIDWYTIKDMDIIGNIHDNPELIGGAF